MARGDALAKFLAKFRTRKESGEGFQVCCPAHEDEDPSLHIKQGRKGVVMTCFSGCSTESIVSALGLQMQELFDDVGAPPPGRPKSQAATRREVVSIKTLSQKFELDEEYLREEVRLRQVGSSVGIPYFDEDGKELFIRRRVKMTGKKKMMHPKKPRDWPEGKMFLRLYGVHRLPKYRKAKHPALLFVEGESDCWVLWKAGVSALGVPGASAVKTVEAQHVEGIKSIYIFQEPGSAGEQFQLKLGERLQVLGFRGVVKVVTLRGSAKDPADLWVSNPEKFPARFRQALKAAIDWNATALEDLVLRMDQVDRKDVSFLWNPYIPLGMVTIVAGKPGLGKSYAMCALAAAISRGGRFPGNADPFEPGNVLLFAAEDDPEFVLRGRLEDNGADLSKIYAYDLLNQSFQFGGESFGRLDSLIDRLKPRLVVFDPIVSFTGSKVDVNRQNEVRGVLQPLVDVARRTGTPIVLVAHVGKGSSSSAAIDAIMGSVDFSAAPRSACIFYPDPNGLQHEECGILAHAKHNLSKAGRSLRYHIDDGHFLWRGESRMSATDLQGASATPSHEKTSTDDAVEFLREHLSLGERPAKEVLARGRSLGMNSTILTRARMQLGVRTRREGFGKGASYSWSLAPEADERDAEETAGEQQRVPGFDKEDSPPVVPDADQHPWSISGEEDKENVPI